jgi:hypothetical protein
MKLRLFVVGASLVAATALAFGGMAMAQGSGTSDDRDEQLAGAQADRARAAAIDALGAGKSTAVERDSDNAYEVEVTKPDGSTVDVELNRSFDVVEVDGPERSNADDRDDDSRDEPDDDDGPNDRDNDDDDGPNDRDDDSDDGPNDD